MTLRNAGDTPPGNNVRMNDHDHPRAPLNRRRLLGAGLAGAGIALATDTRAATPRAGRVPLTVQATEGPYYFDAKQLRADITEGLPGIALEVRLALVDETGTPLPRARVDIWHCNAAGVYSGYAGQGEDHRTDTRGKTFLRGTQLSDREGIAAFRSIYPGWYEGRTTHIHFKVLIGTRMVLTSQFFLPDALSEYLYTQAEDYRRNSVRDTLNSQDGIAIQASATVLGAVRQEADRYVATLTVAVDRQAKPVLDRPPVPGDGPPPGPPPGMAGRGGPPPRPEALEGAARVRALLPGTRQP